MFNYSGIQIGQTGEAGGGGRRRIHWSGNGGEPGPSRVQRDPHPEARSRPVPAGPGNRVPGPGPHQKHGVQVVANDGVVGFKQLDGGAIEVQTKSGKTFPADIVILAIGVKPDTTLAKSAGLAIGERGGIRVDEHMRTSDPDIFAVGDAIEVKDFVTGQWSLLRWPGRRTGRAGSRPM